MNNKKSIQVTPYALAEVIDALTNDPEHFADIVVTKEDGHLIVMFNSTIEECACLNEGLLGGLLGKTLPEKDKPINYPIPKHGDPVLCDINVTSAGENNNTNATIRQTCAILY